MDWLIHLDERVFLAVNGASTPGLDAFFSVVTWGGHGLVLALLILGPLLLFDRARLRAHFLALVLSVSLGALAVEGLKWAVERERPARHFAEAEAQGEVHVRMPAASLYERSFPSGHAQSAFGAATYVALLYPQLALPAAALAVLVGTSRIYLGVHFPLDVAAGALLGVLCSLAGFRLRARWASRRTCSRSRSG